MPSFEELEHMIGGRSPLEPLSDEPDVPAEVVAACQDLLRGYSVMAPVAVAVTSARHGEGRTTIASALAWLLRSELGRPTVLLDLNATGQVGSGVESLRDVVSGRVTLMDAISWTAEQYGCLSLGSDPQRAATDRAAFRNSSVVADLQSAGYSVVGDLPPLLAGGAADRAAGAFTSTILVIRAGVTSVEDVRAAVRRLPDPPGVVVNAVTSPVPRWLPFGRGR